MPELPEVETIRRQLAPHLEGRSFSSVEITDHRWTLPVAPEAIAAELTGARVTRLSRRGKYMVWELDGDRSLLVHLRMTGSLLMDPDPGLPHTRARFELNDGHLLTYIDPRRFGTAHLMPSVAARDTYLQARLGAEPFTAEFTAAYLRGQARGRTAPVKAFILDQRRIAGVGNIYADEALHRARVHPLRPAGSLTPAQWSALKVAIEDALAAGIDAKGASIDDFRHVDGARGSFQDSFLVHTRAGLPCPTCATTIRKLVVGGRGTYVCERCQPRPRVRARERSRQAAA
jgi:formamidopyrimidine-DNA glycosylase